MNKKILAVMAITMMLASCGTKIESNVDCKAVAPEPIKIEAEALGKTNTNFTTDLNDVVESAYQDAASGTTVSQ